MQEVKKALAEDPTKPILIYNHIGYGEIKGTSKMPLSEETRALIDNCPQIVWMTGHTHYAFQDPSMIQQKNFTNIQLPTSGSKWWWVYSAGYTSPASYAYEASQGLILTISDTNVIYAERYDFGTNETIGQKWRIDIPAILRSKENFTYKLADRVRHAKAPEFAANAQLTVDKITTTTATVTTPLITTFKTEEFSDPREDLTELLTVDYGDGIADDRKGHALKTITDGSAGAGPVFKDGKAVFDCKSAYQYTLTAADKLAMASSLTLETTLSVDAVPDHATNWDYGSLISNVEAGGFGLLYIPSGSSNTAIREKLYFEFHVGGSYKNITCPVTLGEEMHVVATYDGYIAHLYVNGQRMGSCKVAGTIKDHGPHTVYVGADYGSGADNAATADLQNYSNATFDMVNLYADAASYDQVQAMYQAAMGN